MESSLSSFLVFTPHPPKGGLKPGKNSPPPWGADRLSGRGVVRPVVRVRLIQPLSPSVYNKNIQIAKLFSDFVKSFKIYNPDNIFVSTAAEIF